MQDEGPAIRIEPAPQCGAARVDLTNVAFSSVFSDHMLTAAFTNGAWQEAVIGPYRPLSLPPSITGLHYGISCFEGLKAQRTSDGDIALFRPADNARRLNASATRLAMPPVPESLFLNGIRELVRLDRAWIPPSGSGALYIRPFYFSTDPSIRVQPGGQYLFVIFTFPFSAYFSAPIDVFVSTSGARAFPGGTGATKAAGNYAAALQMDTIAHDAGCHAVLWLDALEGRYIEECGVANAFFVIGDEVITPALEGTILPGITRASVITLLRDMGHRVTERRLALDEVVASYDRGDLRECFCSGTAATVSHVSRIIHGTRTLTLPDVAERRVGPAVRERLVAVSLGQAADTHGWVERVR